MTTTTQPRGHQTSATASTELDSPAAAQHALEQAALIRAQAAGAHQDATHMVAKAREALATAERRARLLGWIADETEPFAVEFETRARVTNHVRSFREQQPAAQAHLDALETEFAMLTERATELDDRLSELAAERTQLAARLTEARSAGKVTEVAPLRTQLAAVEEVAADLSDQLTAARSRMREIGEPGSGQLLDQTRSEVEALRRQHAQGIDALGPDTENETVQPMVSRFLDHAKQCEGDEETARYTAILAVLDGEPGFTAIMRTARANNAARDRHHHGEQAAA